MKSKYLNVILAFIMISAGAIAFVACLFIENAAVSWILGGISCIVVATGIAELVYLK